MTTPSSPTSTDALARLVGQKRRLLEQLKRLGARQGELIEQGDLTALVRLVSGKQQLVTGLRVVEEGLDAFRAEDPEARQWPSPAHRSACRAEAETCNQLLREVMAAEQEHEQLMTQRRDEIGGRLRQAQAAHVASSAYKPHLRGPRIAPIKQQTESPPLSATLDLSAEG